MRVPTLSGLLPSEQSWLVSLPFPPSAPAAMDDHRVYVPLQGEHFISIARDTGETLWTADIESAWAPLVHDGVVYIAASDELHALDAASGERIWRVPMGGGPMAALAMTQDTIVGLVAPDEVWAFRRTDGQRLWAKPLGGTVGPASMAIDGGRIFVAIGSRLVRVELADGAVKWDRTLPGMLKAPVAHDDRVFVGSTANALHAVSQTRGTITWSYPTGADVIGAAVDGNMVYVASLDNVLRALKQGSGGQVWKKPLNTRPTGPPRVIGGIVAVSGLIPPLATFNAKTGAPIASLETIGDLQRAKFLTPVLFSSKLIPYTVSIVAITRDGRAAGHRPVAMLFRDPPLVPFSNVPGKALTKEQFAPGR
jgi:outer membrane protein assembly factor BamB